MSEGCSIASDDRSPTRSRRQRRPKRRSWVLQRLSSSVSTVRSIVQEPRTLPSQVRESLLKIWRVRGGGFYGLGYVTAFVILEIETFVDNFRGDGDITSMIVQEVLQFLFRFTVQSLLNGLLAFGWPVFVVDYLGAWGLLLIGAGWIVFDRWAKPWIDTKLPDLAGREVPPT